MEIGRSRTTRTERIHTFIGIAAALWLIGAIVAVIDGEALMAVSWFCLAAFGGLVASGLVHRTQWMPYLAIGLVVVAVAISMGGFLAD